MRISELRELLQFREKNRLLNRIVAELTLYKHLLQQVPGTC